MLNIPELIFSATLADAANTQAPAPQGLKPGKLVHVSSAQMPLTVKAKPVEYPADAPWLPARSLSLGKAGTPSRSTARSATR